MLVDSEAVNCCCDCCSGLSNGSVVLLLHFKRGRRRGALLWGSRDQFGVGKRARLVMEKTSIRRAALNKYRILNILMT